MSEPLFQITPLSILIKYWKHSSFRPLQEDIIQSVLAGNDTLAQQIKAGESVESIAKSWVLPIENYKLKRKKYLLYKDFQ